MFWSSEPDEEEEALLCSPALMARRASESWIVAPPVEAMPVAAMSLQRKKSLPDVTQPIQLAATAPLSREEASVLSSMRREEVRKQIYEHERLKANPLLYLVSPQVKDWFSRQQLVMLVLFINISLALMFIKLLT